MVHLAGENVGRALDRRAEAANPREPGRRDPGSSPRRSRELKRPPRVLVSASAMGIYGDRGDEMLTEDSTPTRPADRLPGRAWAATGRRRPSRRAAAGIRVVNLRFGIVLTPAGRRARHACCPPFASGPGGPLGSGKQWVSWISVDDAIGAVHHALFTDELVGPVNAVAPEPVTSRTFAATLGRVLRRPAVLPAPAPALKLLFGEMADTALLGSQRLSRRPGCSPRATPSGTRRLECTPHRDHCAGPTAAW